MEQDGPSFWADIKKYEDTLDKDPNSYCFAPLSELYRKVGMVDDAIIVARRGCELHPEYVGGHMALGRAYFEKGMNSECREALERVIRVTPDNLLAQRILGQIYIDAGDVDAAEESLKTILAQNPDDMESRILLNSLSRSGAANKRPAAAAEEEYSVAREVTEIESADNEFFPGEDDEEIVDLSDAEIVEEITDEKDLEEEFSIVSKPGDNAPDIISGVDIEPKDPLSTVTLAELYVSQGFPERAKAIYRELLEEDQDNAELKNRLIALENVISQDDVNAGEVSVQADISAQTALLDPVEAPVAAAPLPLESGGVFFIDEPLPDGEHYPEKKEEQVIQTLEVWLDNIRRRRNGA